MEVSLIGAAMELRDSKNPAPTLFLSPAEAAWFRSVAKGGLDNA